MDLPLALTGAAPALFAMWYFDRVDAKRPEPRWTLRKVSVAGALSTIPCVIAAYVLFQFAPAVLTYERALYESFVVAAGVEEAAKMLVVYWLVWRRPEFDERLDGIIYATRAGLGFALIENVLYLLAATSMAGFAMTYVVRALLAVPGHAIWAGIMGYHAARKRFDHTGPGLLGGYLVAVSLHGAYDAAIFLNVPLRLNGQGVVAGLLLLVLPAIIIGGALALRRMARRALAADDADAARHAHIVH